MNKQTITLAASFILKTILLVSVSATASFVYAKDVDYQLTSGISQTKMIELYTSEGCSSCPPADRYLSQFTKNSALWKSIIPIAFHVDYWDYIGWEDPYAKPNNSWRQRFYKSLGNVNGVYTPGFIVNGKEWRGFFSGRPWKKNSSQVGNLSIEIKQDQVKAMFAPTPTTKPPLLNKPIVLNIGLLGMGLKQKIKRGENKGKELTHDFVLLKHWNQTSNDLSWSVKLKQHFKTIMQQEKSKHATLKKFALVAWVSEQDKLAPIQAAGMYIE